MVYYWSLRVRLKPEPPLSRVTTDYTMVYGYHFKSDLNLETPIHRVTTEL